MPFFMSVEREVSKEKKRKPKTWKKKEPKGWLDNKIEKEENWKREEEQTTETYIELVKFMRYKPYHSSTCSWGLGTEKEKKTLSK
jgi:hypothetical protein